MLVCRACNRNKMRAAVVPYGMSHLFGKLWWGAVLAAEMIGWLGSFAASGEFVWAGEPAGALAVSGLRVYRIPATLGTSVTSPDGRLLLAAVRGQPELLVIAVEGGVVLGRLRLGEPAEHLTVHTGQLLAAGRTELRIFRLVDLGVPRLDKSAPLGVVVPLPSAEILSVLAPVASTDEAVPEPLRATVTVVARRRGSRSTVFLVRVDPLLGKMVGPIQSLSADADGDPVSQWSLSGDGRRLYRSGRGAPAVYALDEGGRAVISRCATGVGDCGTIVGEPRGRFAFGADGRVLSGDDLRPLGRLAGTMAVTHPELPVLFAFAEGGSAPAGSLEPTARISTVRVYRRPDLTLLGEWTAPGVLTGRRPIVLPDGRLLLTATALQVTDPAAAALLGNSGPSRPLAAGGSRLGGLDTLAALGERLADATVLGAAVARLRPVLLGTAPQPATPQPAVESATTAAESYILLVRVKFEDRLGLAQPQLAAAPKGAIRLGRVWTGTLRRESFRELPAGRVSGHTPRPVSPTPMPEFIKLAGPEALTVEAATGQMSLPTVGLPPGPVPVEVGLRVGTEIVDRLAFDIRVQLPELQLLWPSAPGFEVDAETVRPPALSSVASDGKTLLLVEAGRRRLGAFVLPAPEVDSEGLPAAAILTTSRPIADVADVGEWVAVAVDAENSLLLVDRASLAVRHRVPLGALVPRYLARVPEGSGRTGCLLVGGVDGPARTPRTVCIHLPDGATVGEPIPAAGPMTVLPDKATVAIGGSPQLGTQIYGLADGRLSEVVAPGSTASRWHLPISLGWSDQPERASRLGGWELHPRLPVALLWGEPVELAGAARTAPDAMPTFRTIAITGRQSRPPRELGRSTSTLPVALVSAETGRVLHRTTLPENEWVSALRFAADGREVLVLAGESLQRLALTDLLCWPNSSTGSTNPVFLATTPTTVLEIGRGWSYRPEFLQDCEVRVSVVAGPMGLRTDEAGKSVEWTPSGRDRGTHAVRLSVSGPAGPPVEQTFTLTVQPRSLPVPPAETEKGPTIVPRVIGGAYADLATCVWLTSPDSAVLLRRDRHCVLVLPTNDAAPRRIDLGETVGSVAFIAGREPTALVALPDSRRVALADLATGRVLNRAKLEIGRPTKVLTWGSERLAVTDAGEVRRLEPEFFTDAGPIAHGVMASVSPDGTRLYTVARSEQLPDRFRLELAEALADPDLRIRPSTTGGRGAVVSAETAPRAAAWYLLVYRQTDTSVQLWDAAPLPTRPDELVVTGDGRGLVLLLDGTLTVRSAYDPSEVLRVLSPASEGDRFQEVHPHPAGGAAWTLTRDGHVFRMEIDPVGAVQLQPIELPVPASSDPLADRWLGPARLAVPTDSDTIWWIKSGRAYAVPVSARTVGEVTTLAVTSEPPLLFRAGEPYRYTVRTTRPIEEISIRLRQGPYRAVLSSENATLTWLPDRASRGDTYRVVISVKDRNGQLTGQAFLIRRERRGDIP